MCRPNDSKRRHDHENSGSDDEEDSEIEGRQEHQQACCEGDRSEVLEASQDRQPPKPKPKLTMPGPEARPRSSWTCSRRKEGASIAEIAKATNWLNHSIRGLLSGQVTNKMELKLESEKVEGERRYRLPA
jgi:hypothetical protein